MNEKLGYYTVGDKKFESKIHALIHATKVDKPARWIFNNDEFEKANWVVEPKETLNDLYKRRAKQLRDRYDYLILCYSGGSDSNNILESFISQGLRIDEIVTNFIVDGTKAISNQNISSKQAENHNAEWDLLTKGRMQYIHDNMPGVKISNFDMTKPILDHFKNHEDGSWILKCREWANPMSTARYNIIHDLALRKRVDHLSNVGIMLGVDKPPLLIKDGRLFLQFTDTTANITPMTEHIKAYDNSTVEFFYWSPDSVDILRKQSHIVLQYLKVNKQYQQVWDWKSRLKDNPRYKEVRNIKESILRNVIYTTWNENWFQANKGTIGWTNVNDRWFFDYFVGTVEHHAWQNGIKYMLDNINSKFILEEDEQFLPITGPTYFIGPV